MEIDDFFVAYWDGRAVFVERLDVGHTHIGR